MSPSRPGRLTPGPSWRSFEQLRVQHAHQLAQITPGSYGLLRVKDQQYLIVRAEDGPQLGAGSRPGGPSAAELLEVARLSVESAITRSEDSSLEVARKSLRMLEAELRRQGVLETTDAHGREP